MKHMTRAEMIERLVRRFNNDPEKLLAALEEIVDRIENNKIVDPTKKAVDHDGSTAL